MAKTLVTLTEETILANIDAPKLKEAFSTCAAVARKQTSVGALDAKCADIRDLWEFADTLRAGDIFQDVSPPSVPCEIPAGHGCPIGLWCARRKQCRRSGRRWQDCRLMNGPDIGWLTRK